MDSLGARTSCPLLETSRFQERADIAINGSAVYAEMSAVPGSARHESSLTVAGIHLVAAVDGALYWPEESLLVVADLHLEKGSSFAGRGMLLPPYDSATTLARLTRLLARYAPKRLVLLGDSFHDRHAGQRLAAP